MAVFYMCGLYVWLYVRLVIAACFLPVLCARIRQISKKKAKHCTVSETADMLETEEDLVQKVYDALETYDADTQWEDIMKLVQKG
jgi:hypothetical protein